MLVLSRKVGQKILVGDNLVLQIMKVQGGRVKIAIEAPDSLKIRRGELEEQTPTFEMNFRDSESRESSSELMAVEFV